MSSTSPTLKLTKSKSKNKYFKPEGAQKPPSNHSDNVRFYNVQQIQPYININRPLLTPRKRQIIKKKLQLEREARIVSQYRVVENDMFIRYKRNPFSQLSQRNLNRSESVIPKIRSQKKVHRSYILQPVEEIQKDVTIVEALNRGQKKLPRDNKIKENREFSERMSMLISRSVQKIKKQAQSELKSLTQGIQINRQPSFEKIIELQDVNYYVENQKDINIFAFMKGNCSSIITRDILEKHYFNFMSNVDKNQKIKIPISRDLSKLSREFLMGKFKGSTEQRLENMRSTELSADWEKLTLDNILSIVSGRMTPQLAFNLINQRDIRRDMATLSGRSELSSIDILYNENQNQKLMNFQMKNEEAMEVMNYLELENNAKEKQFAKKCEFYHNNLREHLEKRKKLCRNTIQDDRQHKRIKESIDAECQLLLQLNDNSAHERNRSISWNKSKRSRNDVIKVYQLIESLVMKNKSEAEIAELLKKKAQKRMI